MRRPFVFVLLPFLAGVWLAESLPAVQACLYGGAATCAALAAYACCWRNKDAGVAFAALLLAAGMLRAGLADERLSPHHFAHALDKEDPVTHYRGLLIDFPQEKARSFQAELHLSAVRQDSRWRRATGKVYLYFPKSDTVALPEAGDRLLVAGAPEPPRANPFPYAFDYPQWLAQKGVYHVDFLWQAEEWGIIGQKRTLAVRLSRLRRTLADRLSSSLDEAAAGLAVALTLGQRDRLGAEQTEAFRAAGAAHVLAVSGLHVGALQAAILLALGFLRKAGSGRFLYLAVSLAALWGYACLTGLPASAVRAAAMLSLFLTAQAFRRKAEPLNLLALAAFLILLADPQALRSVGFQLSFAAVAGILYFYPKMMKFWRPKSPIMLYLWQVTAVGLSANALTFPLIAFYFHEFPVYFLLANPVALLGAGLLLPLGWAVIALGNLPMVGPALIFLTETLAFAMRQTFGLLARLPNAQVEDLHLTPIYVGLYYALTFAAVALIERRNARWLYAVLTLAGLALAQSSYTAWQNANRQAVYLYPDARHDHLRLVDGRRSWLLADSTLLADSSSLAYDYAPHLRALGVRHETRYALGSGQDRPDWLREGPGYALFDWKGETVLWARGRSLPKGVKADRLLVGGRARVDLRNVQVSAVTLAAALPNPLKKRLQSQADSLKLTVTTCDSTLYRWQR